jgi:transcriptional regulator with XRE-family HTH domain
MSVKGKGKAYRWILKHLNYADDEWCLIWPFSRDKHGRPQINFDGERWAHRLMCKLVKGEPPTPKHTAAHSCGNGHGGCINPHHLSWKTQAENLEDCRAHGTLVRHHGGNVRRVLPEEVRAIRGARGFQTQAQLAAKFGVSEGTISDIWHGRSHNDNSKIHHWTPEEDAALADAYARGLNIPEAAKVVGRTLKATMTHTYRIGLKSGQPVRKIYDPPRSDEPGVSSSNGDRGSPT